jgi:hypothetical protein
MAVHKLHSLIAKSAPQNNLLWFQITAAYVSLLTTRIVVCFFSLPQTKKSTQLQPKQTHDVHV